MYVMMNDRPKAKLTVLSVFPIRLMKKRIARMGPTRKVLTSQAS